jgi:bacterioferritin-associated ferredoxin
MYVCLCRGITDSQIKQAISEGKASCMRSLSNTLGIAADCGRCGKYARDLLKQSLSTKVSYHNAA